MGIGTLSTIAGIALLVLAVGFEVIFFTKVGIELRSEDKAKAEGQPVVVKDPPEGGCAAHALMAIFAIIGVLFIVVGSGLI